MKIGNNKLGWGEYFKPTPKNVQRMADALVVFSLTMTGYAVIMEVKWLGIVCISIGAIGAMGQKFCSGAE